MKKILFISGARPNLIKLAPLYSFIKKKKTFQIKILHTNQHSNKFMFADICKDLDIPKPDYLINKINTKNNVNMISYFMVEISKVIEKYNPTIIILFGDVDTTIAAALASKKKKFPIIHVEAGLRSNDFNMQEEINRRVTDHLSDLNFCTTISSLNNLKKEGLNNNSFFVGNIIFDNYLNKRKKINNSKVLSKLSLRKNSFILITIHRYQLINFKKKLINLKNLVNNFSKRLPVVFACHTRTKTNLKKYNLINSFNKNIKIINPLSYTDFSKLLISSKVILTDSGGVHEEAYFHNKKCLVLRDKLEREEFVNSKNISKINFQNYISVLDKILKKKTNSLKKIKYWDGKVSQRIYKVLRKNVKI